MPDDQGRRVAGPAHCPELDDVPMWLLGEAVTVPMLCPSMFSDFFPNQEVVRHDIFSDCGRPQASVEAEPTSRTPALLSDSSPCDRLRIWWEPQSPEPHRAPAAPAKGPPAPSASTPWRCPPSLVSRPRALAPRAASALSQSGLCAPRRLLPTVLHTLSGCCWEGFGRRDWSPWWRTLGEEGCLRWHASRLHQVDVPRTRKLWPHKIPGADPCSNDTTPGTGWARRCRGDA